MTISATFVDDVGTSTSHENADIAGEQAQLAANAVHKWCRDNLLELHPTKCARIFIKGHNHEAQDTDIKIGDVQVERKDTLKYLGVHFPEDNKWEEQLRHIKAKIAKATNIIRRLANNENGVNANRVRQLYIALVQSIVDYNADIIMVWLANTRNLLSAF